MKFYLVAMLFVIFDVEIIFLFAWATRFPQLGWYGVAAMGIFTFFVLETLVYVWKRGALDWNVRRRARYLPGRGGPGRVSVRRTQPTNILTTTIDKAARWAQSRSMFPATFGLACCAIEMMATGAAHYDLARFGMEVFRASPRQADLMIVAGRVSQKMAPVLRQVFDQMPDPKWVISMGACASTGGMFNNYALVQGVDQVVPVDIYIPGCPPGPQSLMHGILTLHSNIMAGKS